MVEMRRLPRPSVGVHWDSTRVITRRFVFIVRALEMVCCKKTATDGNFAEMTRSDTETDVPYRGNSGFSGQSSGGRPGIHCIVFQGALSTRSTMHFPDLPAMVEQMSSIRLPQPLPPNGAQEKTHGFAPAGWNAAAARSRHVTLGDPSLSPRTQLCNASLHRRIANRLAFRSRRVVTGESMLRVSPLLNYVRRRLPVRTDGDPD